MKDQFPKSRGIILPEEMPNIDEWLTQERIEDALTRAGFKFKRKKPQKTHRILNLLKIKHRF